MRSSFPGGRKNVQKSASYNFSLIESSPKKRRIIFKHDIDTNKRRKLILDPPQENKPPEADLSEIREVVNDLINNVDKLLQDDLDEVDSSTTELQGKENDLEG